MANNMKLKKNKKSYDNKVITWISIGLAAFVVVVIAIVLVITLTTGYVAKVDGLKIYDYEYSYFLQSALYTEHSENFEKPEGYDDMSDEEKENLEKDFWTDDRKNSCAETALEDTRQFKAQYRLARNAGYKLTSEEKATLKSNITSMYNQYLNYGYSEAMVQSYFLGGMTLSQYKDFAIIQSTIEKYKSVIKKDYEPAEEELRKIYNENPDDYRTIGVRQFKIAVSSKKPTDESADDYQTKLDEYNKEYAEALEYAKEIAETYNAGKKMSTYKKDDDGKYELDKDGKKVVDKADLTFEEYVKLESDDSNSSTSGGLSQINNKNKSSIDEITEYALSMVWNEDRTKIVKKESDKTKAADDEESKEDEESIMTELEIIETETAIYVVRAESITDYENSKESAEGKADSIKDTIKSEWLEDKAVEDLKAKVNDQGDKYKVTGKKEKEIKELNDKMFSTL